MIPVALITGASGGIGYATALAFVRRGTNIGASARRVERLYALEREIAALPAPHGECLTIAADVTDAEAMQQTVAQVVERFGRLDVLVANAGVGHRGALADAEWSDLETILRTNIDGVLHSIRAAIPAMRQSGGGHIVLVSSLAGSTAVPFTAAYGASKAFVSSLARSLSLELEPDHISVTDLVLGPVSTEFSAHRLGTPGYGSQATSLQTMTPEQVADGIVRVTEQRTRRTTLRLFDRLILLVNLIAPYAIGQQAMKRYKT